MFLLPPFVCHCLPLHRLKPLCLTFHPCSKLQLLAQKFLDPFVLPYMLRQLTLHYTFAPTSIQYIRISMASLSNQSNLIYNTLISKSPYNLGRENAAVQFQATSLSRALLLNCRRTSQRPRSKKLSKSAKKTWHEQVSPPRRTFVSRKGILTDYRFSFPPQISASPLFP